MSTRNRGPTLSQRDRAILRAVAAGRAEMTCSCEPDLFIDGLCCCDQSTARRLAHDGLIAPAAPTGSRVRAMLTAAGAATLAVVRP